jgi:hypothetical protein
MEVRFSNRGCCGKTTDKGGKAMQYFINARKSPDFKLAVSPGRC